MVRDAPLLRLDSAQGNGVVHPPVFDTKVKPAGAMASTSAPVALDGPLFVTVIVYETLEPGVTDDGPLAAMASSETTELTSTEADSLLFDETGSAIVDDTVAVLVIGSGVA